VLRYFVLLPFLYYIILGLLSWPLDRVPGPALACDLLFWRPRYIIETYIYLTLSIVAVIRKEGHSEMRDGGGGWGSQFQGKSGIFPSLSSMPSSLRPIVGTWFIGVGSLGTNTNFQSIGL
jgi:hypothetical protein